jgi:hypothetical protein
MICFSPSVGSGGTGVSSLGSSFRGADEPSLAGAAFFGGSGFGIRTLANVLPVDSALQPEQSGETSFRSSRPLPVSASVSPFWVEMMLVFETVGSLFG